MGCQQSISQLHKPTLKKRSLNQPPKQKTRQSISPQGSRRNDVEIINPIYISRGNPSTSIISHQNDKKRFIGSIKTTKKQLNNTRSTCISSRRGSRSSRSNFTPEISNLHKKQWKPSISRFKSSKTFKELHFKIPKIRTKSTKEIQKNKQSFKILDYKKLPSIFKPVRLCTFKKIS